MSLNNFAANVKTQPASPLFELGFRDAVKTLKYFRQEKEL